MGDPLSILVVDDEVAMSAMLVEHLSEAGYRASSASSVEEAVERIAQGGFDIVVSDVRMGGRDGFALLREMRESRRGMPVVLMTSFGTDEIERRALEAGAVAFLRKPFDPAELIDVLQRVIV